MFFFNVGCVKSTVEVCPHAEDLLKMKMYTTFRSGIELSAVPKTQKKKKIKGIRVDAVSVLSTYDVSCPRLSMSSLLMSLLWVNGTVECGQEQMYSK